VDMVSPTWLMAGSMAAISAVHALLAVLPTSLGASAPSAALAVATLVWGANGFVQAFA